ncbi:Iron-sulfur cluster assembly 2, mitochondrial, partial [Perkinsus olseni]
SESYLDHCKVDFVEEMIGSKFVVSENKLAESACSCGASFNLNQQMRQERENPCQRVMACYWPLAAVVKLLLETSCFHRETLLLTVVQYVWKIQPSSRTVIIRCGPVTTERPLPERQTFGTRLEYREITLFFCLPDGIMRRMLKAAVGCLAVTATSVLLLKTRKESDRRRVRTASSMTLKSSSLDLSVAARLLVKTQYVVPVRKLKCAGACSG